MFDFCVCVFCLWCVCRLSWVVCVCVMLMVGVKCVWVICLWCLFLCILVVRFWVLCGSCVLLCFMLCLMLVVCVWLWFSMISCGLVYWLCWCLNILYRCGMLFCLVIVGRFVCVRCVCGCLWKGKFCMCWCVSNVLFGCCIGWCIFVVMMCLKLKCCMCWFGGLVCVMCVCWMKCVWVCLGWSLVCWWWVM